MKHVKKVSVAKAISLLDLLAGLNPTGEGEGEGEGEGKK